MQSNPWFPRAWVEERSPKPFNSAPACSRSDTAVTLSVISLTGRRAVPLVCYSEQSERLDFQSSHRVGNQGAALESGNGAEATKWSDRVLQAVNPVRPRISDGRALCSCCRYSNTPRPLLDLGFDTWLAILPLNAVFRCEKKRLSILARSLQ
jgi:hypothetical protein